MEDKVDEILAFVSKNAEFTEAILWEGGDDVSDWDSEDFPDAGEREALAAVYAHVQQCHIELLKRCRAELRRRDGGSPVFTRYKTSDEKMWVDSGFSLELTGGKNGWQGWTWVCIKTDDATSPNSHCLWASVVTRNKHRHLLDRKASPRSGTDWVGIPAGVQIAEGKTYNDLAVAVADWLWPVARNLNEALQTIEP